MRRGFLLVVASLLAGALAGQISSGPPKGALIVDCGAPDALSRFVALAGGPAAEIVFIPTAASSLKSASGVIYDPDAPGDAAEAFEKDVLKDFGLSRIRILHTRDRRVANSEAFVAPLRQAQGVWFSGGNPGRLASAYLGTRTQRELEALLARGGVIGGISAGAIIQGSYIVRGRPDKPVLMVKGRDRGLAFLQNVAINPHLSGQKRENELVTVVDAYSKLLGIGLDDETAIIVKGDQFEVIGKGRVAIYDNRKHDNVWYYWLKPGERFDLRSRSVITEP